MWNYKSTYLQLNTKTRHEKNTILSFYFLFDNRQTNKKIPGRTYPPGLRLPSCKHLPCYPAKHEIPHYQGYGEAHPHRRAGNRQGLFVGGCLYVGLDVGMLGGAGGVLHGDVNGIGTLRAGLLLGGRLALSPSPVQDEASRREARAVEVPRPRGGYVSCHLLHPLGEGYPLRLVPGRRLPVALRGGAVGGLGLRGYSPGSAA